MPRQLLLLELNEINFEYVAAYHRRGLLPHLGRLIRQHGITRTVSEQRYEELEPWIQWVTAHTGKRLAEHRVFRLGDIVKHDLPQIWEELEARGLRVGAVSPMNAKNRLRDPAFFVPDPWTPTTAAAGRRLRALHAGIARAVNENAQARLPLGAIGSLLAGFLAYARVVNYREYARLAVSSRSRPWRKAMLLDLLLADVFVSEVKRTRPDFASLFLNAGAHIQHHYLFSSACYAGPNRNPDWYLPPGADPVLEAYETYDRIVAQVSAACPAARLLIATGLHQEPHGQVTYYWRLREHARFLRRAGVPFERVEPRMSRDFVVACRDGAQALRAAERLEALTSDGGTPLFSVDNRGSDLFVELSWASEIGPGFGVRAGSERLEGFDRDVSFVALKNGEHDGIGYLLDTGGARVAGTAPLLPLSDLYTRVMGAFGFAPDQPLPSAAAGSA